MVMFIMGVMFMTGCGGSDEAALILSGQDPVAPGTCTEAGPAVISSNPTDGDEGVSRNKVITVTFSEAMDPGTIVVNDSADPEVLTFTLRDNNEATNTRGRVAMSMSNTVATFTPDALLNADSWYTVRITKYAASALGTSLSCNYKWSFKTGTAIVAGQEPVNLGTAGTYGIFASADAPITLQVNALVEGDVGLMDGLGECNGCDVPTTVTGTIHNGDTAAQQAQIDLTAAYNDAMNRSTNRCTLAAPTDIAAPQGACTGYTDPPGSIGSTTFNTYLPGLYWSATAIDLGVDKTIVLDAQGDSNAVFIFQSASYITTGTGSEVILTGNARAKNVFWLAGSATTLGVSSRFKGTVITGTEAATVNGGTVSDPTLVEGRLFSGGAAVTVNSYATVTVPAP
jgi:hypothetical protein